MCMFKFLLTSRSTGSTHIFFNAARQGRKSLPVSPLLPPAAAPIHPHIVSAVFTNLLLISPENITSVTSQVGHVKAEVT